MIRRPPRSTRTDTLFPYTTLFLSELAALTDELGFQLIAREIPLGDDGEPRAEQIAPQLAELKAAGVDFLYLGSSSFLRKHSDILTGAALDQGIPVLSPYEELVRESRALMSVAARYYDVGRIAEIGRARGRERVCQYG